MPRAPRLAEPDGFFLGQPVDRAAALGDRREQPELLVAADIAALPPDRRKIALERLGLGHRKDRPLRVPERHLLVVALRREVCRVGRAAQFLVGLTLLGLGDVHRGHLVAGRHRTGPVLWPLVVRGRRLIHNSARVDHRRRGRHQLRAGRERDRVRRLRHRRQLERPARLLPRPQPELELGLNAGRRRHIVLDQIAHDVVVERHPDVAVFRRQPVIQFVLDRDQHRLDRMLHQPRARLDVLRAGQAGVARRRRDPDHARVDAVGRANILTRDPPQVRELEVAQRKAERLDIPHRAKKRRRPALPAVDHARPVPVLHRQRVVRGRLIRQQHRKRRRPVVRDDLPDVACRLVVGRHAGDRGRAAGEAEHVREERPRHIKVAEVQDVLDRHLHDDAGPVAVIVAPRVAFLIDPNGLQRFGVDRPQRQRQPARGRPFHLKHRVAVAEVVDCQPRAHRSSRHARPRIVEQPLQRVVVRHPRLVVALLAQHHKRHRGDDIGHDANTGMDDRMLIEAERADRRAVRLVFLRVRGPHQRQAGHPAARRPNGRARQRRLRNRARLVRRRSGSQHRQRRAHAL